jgi:excinuclease UvrABC ATPase subunit
VDAGSTPIAIEHNLDVISRAGWVIDLGPGAGHDGDQVQFEGVPADLAGTSHSLTGQHLAARTTGPAQRRSKDSDRRSRRTA